MPSLYETDIINSATPLEMKFAGVHPRLYATDQEIDAIKGKLTREPWAGFLRRARAMADGFVRSGAPAVDSRSDIRGFGDGLAHLAVVYRFTGEKVYLDTARQYLVNMAANSVWNSSLPFGHWAHGIAVAYDWLYHELDEPLRRATREALFSRARGVFKIFTAYADAMPTGYAWNHTGVTHNGLFAAGCAIWGDIDGVGPILRLGLEKLRLLVDALGPDGASAEGLAYGQYHNDAVLKSMMLADRLMNVDFFEESVFFRNYPQFLLHSSLPRPAWAPHSTFMVFGDADGAHWYGPDAQLRLVACCYRDGTARWLADATAAAGICADSACFLNLIYHDETVTPQPPEGQPTMRHLNDKDIVFMRSGWGERAALMGIKCGHNQGYHASRRYRQNVGGGHMHPDAGHIMLHAGGDWLLTDAGYTKKFTSYRNTLLVNGIGQTGEGATWFEDLEMRRGKPEGRIIKADAGEEVDYVIADAAPAYECAARLTKFLRHVLYLKPDVWLLIDELEAQADSTFELRFHAPRPFVAGGDAAWSMKNDRTTLRLTALGPTPLTGRAFADMAIGASASHQDRQIETLAITNANPAPTAIFVTLLHAHPAGVESGIHATLGGALPNLWVDLKGRKEAIRVKLNPGQHEPGKTIYSIVSI